MCLNQVLCPIEFLFRRTLSSDSGELFINGGFNLFRRVIAAGPEKVHLDVQFTRYLADGSALGHFRSLYVLARRDGRWGIVLRSTFAG